MKDILDSNGLDLRTLESLERSWIRFHFKADQWFEDRPPPERESLGYHMRSLVRGTFVLGYRETGTAEAIEAGVRTGKLAWSATGSST